MVKGKDGLTPWVDTIPKEAVIMCAFELDEKNHLLENTRKFLKKWYRDQAKEQWTSEISKQLHIIICWHVCLNICKIISTDFWKAAILHELSKW